MNEKKAEEGSASKDIKREGIMRRGVVFITPNNEYYRNKNLGFGWAITHETETELTWGEDVMPSWKRRTEVEEPTKTVGERIDEYLEEYKAADEFHRNVLGGIAGAEAYKWEQIFKGIQKIDGEEERAEKEELEVCEVCGKPATTVINQPDGLLLYLCDKCYAERGIEEKDVWAVSQ